MKDREAEIVPINKKKGHTIHHNKRRATQKLKLPVLAMEMTGSFCLKYNPKLIGREGEMRDV